MSTEQASGKSIEPKVAEILDRLDQKAQEATLSKSSNRWRYRRANMSLTIEHLAGGVARSACYARMIWRDGIALLCSSFSYPGSPCTLVLVSSEGDLLSIRGSVEVCRHVQGSFHEVEIKFNQRIDPQMFVGSGGNESAPLVDLTNLRAHILHLDDSEADARLLAHHLRGSGIKLTSVRTSKEALAAITATTAPAVEIFLCDLNLGREGDASPFIRAARAAEFTGPIVVVTAESHPAKLAAAKEAGATHVLMKPFMRDGLIQMIVGLNREVGAIAGDVLYSSLSDQADAEELISSYIADMKRTAQSIDEAVVAKDLDGVRRLCLTVKGTAASYGFPALSGAATEALTVLDSTMGIDEAKSKLRALTLMTNQLTVRPKVGAGSALDERAA